MKRIAMIVLGFSVFFTAWKVSAQSQDQSSLGDYARQVRKPSGNPSKPKVFDNDNLPKDDKLSIVGPAPGTTASDESAATKAEETTNTASPEGKPQPNTKSLEGKPQADTSANTSTEPKPAAGEAKSSEQKAKSPDDEEAQKQAAWKQWQDKLSAQKDSIDLLSRELDVLQREYQIRAAAIYADVGNRLRNQSDWDKQDAQYKQQIADKQKAIDDAKQKLDDMLEDARKAGVPANMREH